MALNSNLQIDGDRLWDALMEMAKIGPGVAGGNNRQTLTDEDGEGRRLFQSWAEAAGMTMGVDTMGNMFFRREGADPDALPVYVGSHLDTQPTGGKYDGVLGVLGALELVRTLNDLNIKTRHPIVVTNWTNEEGTRFAPAMLASGVFAGVHEEEWAKARLDAKGKSFGDELKRIGYDGDMKCAPRELGAFFEAHIEQGPILEAEEKTIGVVQGVQGIRWFEIEVTGMESHAGTTPMERRKDALVGAARMVGEAHRIGEAAMPNGRTTIGYMEVTPNSTNVIPGKVFFRADIRNPDAAALDGMESEFQAACEKISVDLSLSLDFKRIWYSEPVIFDEDCVAAVQGAANALGLANRPITSGAGHDAVYVSRLAPTAMIFIPCEDGISHNEIEEATPGDLAAGCEVLLNAMVDRANA